MARASCGCPAEDSMALHGFDGPCAARHDDNAPTAESHCASDGHPYHGDDNGTGRCYCGQQAYPQGDAR